jgi:hypothetical protein
MEGNVYSLPINAHKMYIKQIQSSFSQTIQRLGHMINHLHQAHFNFILVINSSLLLLLCSCRFHADNCVLWWLGIRKFQNHLITCTVHVDGLQYFKTYCLKRWVQRFEICNKLILKVLGDTGKLPWTIDGFNIALWP